jgi:phosphoribosyl 1,2-cyclic phosphate phosphodiesterase
MDVHILGTTANEGWPAIWCDCEYCRRAWAAAGKDRRTRSSAIVDDVFKFDWPPDTLHHIYRYGLRLHRLKHLVFTHSHDDHFYPEDIGRRCDPYAHVVDDPGLDIWGPPQVTERLQGLVKRCNLRLHTVEPFTEYTLDDAILIPLPADHSTGALLYLFCRNVATLFYGHDSGYYPEPTWDFLARRQLDIALLDCTNGAVPQERFHMGMDTVRRVRQRLQDIGCLRADSRVVATHFSHNGGLLHAELEVAFAPDGIEVAYDGMHLITP